MIDHLQVGRREAERLHHKHYFDGNVSTGNLLLIFIEELINTVKRSSVLDILPRMMFLIEAHSGSGTTLVLFLKSNILAIELTANPKNPKNEMKV